MIALSSATEAPPRGIGARDAQRLYLMLKPYRALALEIDRLRRSLDLDHGYPADRFHITLQPFGDASAISSAELARIRAVAASLQAAPFRIMFDRVRGNALVSGNSRALRDFQRLLATHLAASGVFLPDYGFDPHLSLLYGEWWHRNMRVQPIGWRVEELFLINSIRGKGHAVLGRWSLQSRQGAFAF